MEQTDPSLQLVAAPSTHDDPTALEQTFRSLRRRRFIGTYFAQLELEYESLCSPEFRRASAARMEKLRATHRTRSSWTNNHRLEMLVMEGIHPSILLQRVAIYRERLQGLVGTARASALSQAYALPPDADADTQRQAALGLLAEIQRLRAVRSEFERLRNRLLVSLLVAGALFGGVTYLLLLYTWSPPVLHVFAAGLLGGYFSVL